MYVCNVMFPWELGLCLMLTWAVEGIGLEAWVLAKAAALAVASVVAVCFRCFSCCF